VEAGAAFTAEAGAGVGFATFGASAFVGYFGAGVACF